MRSRVVHNANLILVAFAIVMAPGTVARFAAFAQAPPAGSAAQTTATPPRVITGDRYRVEAHHTRHHAAPGAHKAEAQHAVPPAGKIQAATTPRGAKGQGSTSAPGAAQPAHGTAAPVPTAPPTPKPPAEPPAAEPAEPAAKIPRFAALKTDETNMRKGPGQRYPIEWVYKRHDLPMEVEREYDVWRYVRDPDGVEGWVHQVTLSDRRTFIVQDKEATLRADAKDTASPVATLKVGVIGRLRECDAGSNWCQVQVSGYKGYLRRDQFWGLLPDEAVGPS